MKNFSMTVFLSAAALGSSAVAQTELREFSEADRDGDGQLSIEEAREVLPDNVAIVDVNNDGQLNPAEARSALPEVSFTEQSQAEGGIGEAEYEQIRQRLEMRESPDALSPADQNPLPGERDEGREDEPPGDLPTPDDPVINGIDIE